MGERLRKRNVMLSIVLIMLLYSSLLISSVFLRSLVATVFAAPLILLVLLQGSSYKKGKNVTIEDAVGADRLSEKTGPDGRGIEDEAQEGEICTEGIQQKLQVEAHRHVMEALSGMAKIIPVMNKQLQAVIDYTEEAAMELSRSFIGISRQAKEQVQDVRQVFGSISKEEAEGGSESALVSIRKNLNTLTEGLETLLEQIKKNSDSMNGILRQTKSIEEIVVTTSEITENSRVLSINATIEAARAGEHGRGFAVVAGEFKQMTERSEDATAKIEATVKMITQIISQVKKEIEESKNISRHLGEQTKTTGGESLDKIDAMIDETKTGLDKLSGQTESFAKDINSIIMSIQFQDITRQRIEHVIEPLQEFAEDLEKIVSYIEHIDHTDSVQQLSNFDSAVDRLKEKYTMEAEKELMKKSLAKEAE